MFLVGQDLFHMLYMYCRLSLYLFSFLTHYSLLTTHCYGLCFGSANGCCVCSQTVSRKACPSLIEKPEALVSRMYFRMVVSSQAQSLIDNSIFIGPDNSLQPPE